MDRKSALFVCIHNSARSQMAEAFLKHYGSDLFDRVESAGIEAGTLNPLVVEVMAEKGIDLSGNQTKKAMTFVASNTHFDYVITVCDEANAERCPIFPGIHTRLKWFFEDPSAIPGPDVQKLVRIRRIRDEIEEMVANWAESLRIRSSEVGHV